MQQALPARPGEAVQIVVEPGEEGARLDGIEDALEELRGHGGAIDAFDHEVRPGHRLDGGHRVAELGEVTQERAFCLRGAAIAVAAQNEAIAVVEDVRVTSAGEDVHGRKVSTLSDRVVGCALASGRSERRRWDRRLSFETSG